MKAYSVTVDLVIYGNSSSDAENRTRAILLAAASKTDADLESYEIRDGMDATVRCDGESEDEPDDWPDTQYDTLEERDAERELDRINGLSE